MAVKIISSLEQTVWHKQWTELKVVLQLLYEVNYILE